MLVEHLLELGWRFKLALIFLIKDMIISQVNTK